MGLFYTLCAILFFGLLIATHELGHFLVAKLCGVRVNEFSIGMGPQLLKKQGKETVYSLRLLPFGGFCAMEGEDEATDDPRSFASAAAWKRFCILAAGACMNFLTGVVILVCLYSGVQSYVSPTLSSFMEGNPAGAEEYLHEGDRLIKIDGHFVLTSSDVSTLLSRGNGETADVVVLRDGQKVALFDVPLALREYQVDGETQQMYGLYFSVESADLPARIALALKSSVNFVRMVWFSLEDLFTGAVGLKDLSGPIGIVSTMSEVGQTSATVFDAFVNLLYLGSFIAINLAVMNLLPLPALDGGRLFFLLLNGILWLLIRHRIPAKYESYVHYIGLLLLLGLMVVVALQDVFRIIS